jgi:hypothetical protein
MPTQNAETYPFAKLTLDEGPAPASPPAGSQVIYIDEADHLPKRKNAAGAVASLGGADGADGSDGADGVGVPAGGSTGEVLAKASGADHDTEWVPPGAGAAFSTYDALIAAMSGLVHRWTFEEASGNFADAVGSLTLTKSGTFTYAVAGGPVSGGAGSVTVGAAGQGVSSGLGSIPVAGAARTFVLIYKGKSSTAKQALFSYGTSGSTRLWWTAYLNESGSGAANDALCLAAWGDDAGLLGCNLNVETWHMAAFGYDGASTTFVFLDGQILGRRLGGALNTGSGGNLAVAFDAFGGNQLGGVTLDDLAVFSRALQPYELQQLYNALVGALP